MAKGITGSVLKPIQEDKVSFDELEQAADDSRTGNDNQFIKRVGSSEYLFNRVTIPADRIKELVDIHPLNPRIQKFLNNVSLSKLMKEIVKTNGVQQPPVCVYDNGKYKTLDGSRRTMASLILGYPLTIEYTADNVSDEDAKAYIEATDTNENQSAYENVVDLHIRYIDFKANWEKDNAGKFKDEFFLAESEISQSTLSRAKSIVANLNEHFFFNGDPNKFTYRDLAALASLIKKPAVNFKDTFYDKVGKVFESCLSNVGDDWDFNDFKKEFNAEFGIKSVEQTGGKGVLCMITLEAGDDFKDFDITVSKKKKSFSVEFPFEMTDEIEKKLRELIVKEFDNN